MTASTADYYGILGLTSDATLPGRVLPREHLSRRAAIHDRAVRPPAHWRLVRIRQVR